MTADGYSPYPTVPWSKTPGDHTPHLIVTKPERHRVSHPGSATHIVELRDHTAQRARVRCAHADRPKGAHGAPSRVTRV